MGLEMSQMLGVTANSHMCQASDALTSTAQEPYNPRPYLMEFRKYPGVASGLGAEYFYRDEQKSLLVLKLELRVLQYLFCLSLSCYSSNHRTLPSLSLYGLASLS